MKKRLFALISMLLILLLAGCGKKPASEAHDLTAPETTTDQVSEEETVPSWQQVYTPILERLKETYGATTEYFLYDIDADDTPELFVKEGTTEANFQYCIRTCKDGAAADLGAIGGGHTVICGTTQPGTFLQYFGQMGQERVWLCTVENGTVTQTEIYYCASMHVSEYLPLQSIPRLNMEDPFDLQWNGNPDIDNLSILSQAKAEEADAAKDLLGEDYGRITGICSALYDTNCSMGGHDKFYADTAEDRLIFVFAHLLAGDDIMPDAPTFVVDNRPEGRICTIGKEDMDRLNTYFFASEMEHGESSFWELSHNITVTYENGMYTYDSPPGDFGATTGVAVITNMVPDGSGNYCLTLAGFTTRPGMMADVDYSALSFDLLTESEDFEFTGYRTATVTETDGQYAVSSFFYTV